MWEREIDDVRARYAGAEGDRLRRLRAGRASVWSEHNEVEAVAHAERTAVAWLEGVPRVLEVGCGPVPVTAGLAAGARVVAVDLVEAFVEAARGRAADAGRSRGAAEPAGGGGEFHVGDIVDMVRRGVVDPSAFDVVVASRVLDDYSTENARALLDALLALGVPRVVLAFRVEPDGEVARWIARRSTRDAARTLDPVEVLRRVHLETDYRLAQRSRARCRDHAIEVVDLRVEREEP